MDELRQNKSDLDWPNGLCGKPLPPAVEEWLRTRDQGKRESEEAFTRINHRLEETKKTIDRLKRSVGLE
jgi:hypothetical protein